MLRSLGSTSISPARRSLLEPQGLLRSDPSACCTAVISGDLLTPLLFFKIVLLTCNLHTIEFIHFKCTIQWILVYLQSCRNQHNLIFQHLQSLTKRPVCIYSHFLFCLPAVDSHWSTVCLYTVPFYECFTKMEPYNLWSYVTLCLDSFTEHKFFQVHPCCSMG
jgi:hypothetical protein